MVNQSSYDQRRHKLEDTLTAKVKEWLEFQPDLAFQKISDRYSKGVSDFIICVRGIMVCAELKRDEGKPSAQQLQFIDTFRKAGAVCGVCWTLGEVKALVEEARVKAGGI